MLTITGTSLSPGNRLTVKMQVDQATSTLYATINHRYAHLADEQSRAS
jgi:hypothetical protein